MKLKGFKISRRRAIVYLTYAVMIMLTIILKDSFSDFTNRNESDVANIKVADMNYNLVINGAQTTTLYVPANDETIANIIINSLNTVDSYYEVIYGVCPTEECTSLIETPSELYVEYSSRTTDPITEVIKADESKIVRLGITNNTSTGYYLKFGINAGYIHNTLTLEGQIENEYNEEDLTIVAIIDGVISDTFPTTNDYNTIVECLTNKGASNASGTATWNGTIWIVDITGADSGKTVCNVEFYKGLREKILAQGGGTATIEAKGTPDFNVIAPAILTYKEVTNTYTSSLSSNNNRTIGTGYTFNETTGKYRLTNYQTSQTYNQDHVGQYTCNSSLLSSSTIYKINTVTGTSVTNSTRYQIDGNTYNYSDTGLYAAEDEYGTSYYYRGDKEKLNNNLIWGGFQWKIVRINGDGSIKVVYNGTQAQFSRNGTVNTGANTQIGTAYWNTTNNNDAKYVGYMYGGLNGDESTQRDGIESTAATYNQTNTNIKTVLENWYKTNIFDKGFESQVADNLFCNDRQLRSDPGVGGESTGPGYGGTTTYYAAQYRLNPTKTPTLKCGLQNDQFTTSVDGEIGNGALTYPVGLLTAYEASMAGLVYVKENETNYLYTDQFWWSFSPFSMDSINGFADIIVVYMNGMIGSNRVSNSSGVRPSVSIISSTRVTGTGSATDPFIALPI